MNSRSWLWGVVGAVLAVAVTVGVVRLVSGDDDPGDTAGPSEPTSSSTPDDEVTPSDEPSPTVTPSDEPAAALVGAYFIGDAPRRPVLYREFLRVEGEDTPSAALAARPNDPDYRAPWAGLGLGFSATGDKDLVTVDLLADDLALLQRPAGMNAKEAQLSLEAMMRTAQGVLKAGRAPVQFLANGKHVNEIFGQPTSEALANSDDDDVLAHVWIDDPAEGATVSAGDQVTGLASSFEATVTWVLRRGTEEVESGFTTAEEAFRMAPYAFDLPDVPAGDYTLVVSEDDPSGGEGGGPHTDSRNLTFD